MQSKLTRGKILSKYYIYPGNKLEKLKIHSQLRESISAFYFPHLEESIHVSLHIGNRHLLHDDVRDPTFKKLPLHACRLGSKHPASQPFSLIYFSIIIYKQTNIITYVLIGLYTSTQYAVFHLSPTFSNNATQILLGGTEESC